MSDIEIQEITSRAALEQLVKRRHSQTESYQGNLAQKYRRLHHYFAPQNGDQWPEDQSQRPGMIHMTHNIIAPVVITESRIESLQPKISLRADSANPEIRARAEKAEKLFLRWLELSGWDTWLFDLCQTKAIYGKGILKPYWNKRDKRPDVRVVENPANLRLGWGASDYSELDWALYEYAISPFEVQRRYPGLVLNLSRDKKRLEIVRGGDHADPLNQKSSPQASLATPTGQSKLISRPVPYLPSDYEQLQARVWDYWYKESLEDGDVLVKNAVFVEGVLAEGPHDHPEYPDIPYLVIEHDHEPGSPEGIGDVEGLIDHQIELNRAFSHYAQLVADEVDPAYQIDAEVLPPGMVSSPRGGSISATGEGKQIRPIEKGVNQFPIDALIDRIMGGVHFRSGLPEILFATSPGAQTAGRALQLHIEAAANRIDPRRRRLYANGIVSLLHFWAFMTEKVNPMMTLEDGERVRVGDEIRGLRRWRIIAPEITPRDNLELITGVVNKLNAKLISLEDAMDELGVDSPLEMIRKIENERMNPRLYPGDVQAFVAVLDMLQQYAAAAQQLGLGGPALDQALGGAGLGQQQLEAQRAQPQGVPGDNGSGVPQPATAEGGPPPPGAPGPGGLQNQTLIRAQPSGGAQTLQQIRTVTGGGA